MGLSYKPMLFHIPYTKKIVQLVAGQDSFAVIDGYLILFIYLEDNEIFMFNDYLEPNKAVVKSDYRVFKNRELFNKGKVTKLGGGYGQRYALVTN